MKDRPSSADLQVAWRRYQSARGRQAQLDALAEYRALNSAFFKAGKPRPQTILRRSIEDAVVSAVPDAPKRSLNVYEWGRLVQSLASRMWGSFQASLRGVVRTAYVQGAREASPTFIPVPQDDTIIRELSTGIVNSTFKGFDAEAGKRLQAIVIRHMEQGRNPKTSAVVTDMANEVGGAMRWQLERIARTEVNRVQNTAAMIQYRRQENEQGQSYLYRYGPRMGPTMRANPECEACIRIIGRTAGGVGMDELIRIVGEEARIENPRWNSGPSGTFPMVHPCCRHTAWKVPGQVTKAIQVVPKKSVEMLVKWVEEPSQTSTRRWRNTLTKEVRYQDNAPTSRRGRPKASYSSDTLN